MDEDEDEDDDIEKSPTLDFPLSSSFILLPSSFRLHP